MNKLFELIADILGVSVHQIELTDSLSLDWAIGDHELEVLEEEFCAQFGVNHSDVDEAMPTTVKDYATLAGL